MANPIQLEIEREDGERESFTFRPARMSALLKAGKVAHTMGQIWTAVQGGDQGRAVVILLEAFTDRLSRETILDLLLDSMRRDATEPNRKWILDSFDGPALMAMLAGAIAANVQRAGPLLMRLGAGAAASLTEEIAAESAAGSSSSDS